MNKRAIGNKGEDLAEEYLIGKGYKIICRNYTIRGGEIDIIALDKDELVFVEVKSRSSDLYGTASEAVDFRKLTHLQRAADVYLQKVQWGSRPYRFDVVTIDMSLPDKEAFNLLCNVL